MEVIEDVEDSRDYLTIYKKDYLGKRDKAEYKLLPKYPLSSNILNESYKYLNTRLKNQSLPKNERSEDPVDYLNRIRDKFCHLRNALPEIVPDENVIEREEQKSIKTVYQLDYLTEIRKDHPRREIILPQDWIIPETIQKRAYRNPWIIATRELIKPSKIFKPCNNLDPNLKEREILRITTGNSEYSDTIGIARERIKQIFPEMKDSISLQNSYPGISDSECSLILKQHLVLPAKIF